MRQPDWQTADGAVRLFLGDCLELLPQMEAGSVDAVVTDPPYGIGFTYESHDDDAESYGQMMMHVVGQVHRLQAKTAVFWQGMLNCSRWHQWFPQKFRLFAACKGFVQFRPISVQYSWDPVIWWGEPAGDPSVYRKDWHLQSLAPFGAGRERIDHPCPRPLEQVIYVVDVFSASGDRVLDPFTGSGTTGVACIRTGRRFIGIEKEPRYFDIAVKRIEAELQRTALFEPPPTIIRQASLFGGESEVAQ